MPGRSAAGQARPATILRPALGKPAGKLSPPLRNDGAPGRLTCRAASAPAPCRDGGNIMTWALTPLAQRP